MSQDSLQPWKRRQEIPDPQVKDAANQYEASRKFLENQPPGSGVLLPLLNVSAIAIELYLKCLSSEKVYEPTGDSVGSSIIHAKPLRGHDLKRQFGFIPNEIKVAIDQEFKKTSTAITDFESMLERCEGVYAASRYPFEEGNEIPETIRDLMRCSAFLSEFVNKLEPVETIEWGQPNNEVITNHTETARNVREELHRTLKLEFKFINDLLEFSLSILRRCESSELTKGTQYSFQISLVMYIRAYNSALVAYELFKSGFPYHAVMICRSLFEDLVNLKYLNNTDVEKKADRYRAFRGLKQARAIKDYRKLVEEAGLSNELKEAFELARNQFKKNFPDGENWIGDWSGTSLEKKAEAVGMLSDYVIVQSQLSSYLHGGPEGVDAGMRGIKDGKQQHLIGPRTDGTIQGMATMAGYLIFTTEEMVKKFELNDMKEKISELSKTCTADFSKYIRPFENIL
jgi:hypothetical protein